MDTKDPIWTVRTKYGHIKRPKSLKYLGQILTLNFNEKASLKKGQERQSQRLDLQIQIIPLPDQIQIVKPESAYAIVTAPSKGLSEIGKKERKFLIKMPELKKLSADQFTLYLRPNQKLYDNFEIILIMMKERQMTLCRYVRSIRPESIRNKILTFQTNRKAHVP